MLFLKTAHRACQSNASQLIHTARRLYLNSEYVDESQSNRSLLLKTELNRRLLKGYTQYSDNAEVISLMGSLRSYTASLAALGLTDRQLLSMTAKHAHFSILFLLPKLTYRALKLTVLTIFTLPGLLLFAPIFVVTSRVSKRKT
jgi:glycerol-3-phosphate O-acyltransferase/dihydroxyacetone phosphate acyltransferase